MRVTLRASEQISFLNVHRAIPPRILSAFLKILSLEKPGRFISLVCDMPAINLCNFFNQRLNLLPVFLLNSLTLTIL